MVKIDFKDKKVVLIFWVTIIVLFIYLYLVVEPRHNACWDLKRDECHLDKFKVDAREGDSNADLLRRLEGYTNLDQEKVFWRRYILNAIVASALLLMLYHRKILIPPQQFIIITLILFIAFYFHNSYYSMHFDLRSNIFAQATINELRYRLNIATRPTAKDFNHVR